MPSNPSGCSGCEFIPDTVNYPVTGTGCWADTDTTAVLTRSGCTWSGNFTDNNLDEWTLSFTLDAETETWSGTISGCAGSDIPLTITSELCEHPTLGFPFPEWSVTFESSGDCFCQDGGCIGPHCPNTECCPETHIPDTITATIEDVNGFASIDELTGQLVFDEGFWVGDIVTPCGGTWGLTLGCVGTDWILEFTIPAPNNDCSHGGQVLAQSPHSCDPLELVFEIEPEPTPGDCNCCQDVSPPCRYNIRVTE